MNTPTGCPPDRDRISVFPGHGIFSSFCSFALPSHAFILPNDVWKIRKKEPQIYMNLTTQNPFLQCRHATDYVRVFRQSVGHSSFSHQSSTQQEACSGQHRELKRNCDFNIFSMNNYYFAEILQFLAMTKNVYPGENCCLVVGLIHLEAGALRGED